jgi:hypothetical protein
MLYICLLTLSLWLAQCGQPEPLTGEHPVTDANSPACVAPETTGQGGVSPVEPTPEPTEPTQLLNYELARLSIGLPPVDSINHWLAFVGLPPANPFCSAANSWWNEKAGVWHPRSGLARHFKTRAPVGMWVDASKVLRGQVNIPAGSVCVFERGNTIYGHVGIVTRDFTGAGSLYISGNTSAPGTQGSEFSGGGVWEKPFTIVPGAAFRITGFVVYQ